MTTGVSSGARPGRFARYRADFRAWRRVRPFWGGLLTLLAGLEIFATTQGSLGGLSFQMGPTGFLSWLLPAILVTCGLLLWYSPQQRIFYAVVAAVTAVFALIGVNLGGFLIGTLLGMFGSALGFAWAPVAGSGTPPTGGDRDAGSGTDGQATSAPDGPPADVSMAELFTEGAGSVRRSDGGTRIPGSTVEPAGSSKHPALDAPTVVQPAIPAPRAGGDPDRPAYLGEPRPGTAGPAHADRPTAPPADTGRGPGLLVVPLLVLSLSAVGLVTVRTAEPAAAAPCRPGPTGSGSTRPTGDPTSTPTASPSPGQSPSPGPARSLLDSIVDGFNDLLGIGRSTPGPSTPGTPAPGTPTVATPAPRPTGTPVTTTSPGTEPGCGPTAPAGVEPRRMKKLKRAAGQPSVADFSQLTGSKLTMTDLRIEGVTTLPTADGGTVKVLKFSMSKAVTEDFRLTSPLGLGSTLLTRSAALTIEDDVVFYASRFSGRVTSISLGLDLPLPLPIPLTMTPDKVLLPDGFPLTLPGIEFDRVQIQLVYVDCGKLSVKPNLTQTST